MSGSFVRHDGVPVTLDGKTIGVCDVRVFDDHIEIDRLHPTDHHFSSKITAMSLGGVSIELGVSDE